MKITYILTLILMLDNKMILKDDIGYWKKSDCEAKIKYFKKTFKEYKVIAVCKEAE